ncbi:hypothetical protein [Streptomyces sp. NPDC060035]|uniref:hypothetical protein n=1 Tax=Streptomyces sp. NPDC060035 TaxID=3347044 RepID=UPI0036B6AA3E
MKNTGADLDSADLDPEYFGNRRWQVAAEWAWPAFLAAGVLVIGLFVGVLGPLLALACDSCQDGIRGRLRFQGAFFAVAWFAVPLTASGTAVGVFFPRGGTRVAVIGTGVLAVLQLVMMVLGHYAA